MDDLIVKTETEKDLVNLELRRIVLLAYLEENCLSEKALTNRLSDE